MFSKLRVNRLLGLFLLFPLFSLITALLLSWQNLSSFRLSVKAEPKESVFKTLAKNKSLQLLSRQAEEIIFAVQTPPYKLLPLTVGGKTYQLIKMEGTLLDESEPGKAALPLLNLTLKIPSQSICHYEIQKPVWEEIPQILLYPAQKPLAEESVWSAKEFVKDEIFYQQNSFYPASIVRMAKPQILRGKKLQTIYLSPFQYNPAQKLLRHYKSFQLKIICPGETTEAQSPSVSQNFFPSLQQTEELKLKAATEGEGEITGADLLIITPEELRPAAETLALWRRQKGFYAQVKTTAETGTTAEAITNYIKDAYFHWNPAPSFVLLLGDAEFIPPHYKTPHPYENNRLIGTDLYYATIDGDDYLPDLALGRIAVDTLAEAETIINKIVEYEKNPPGNDNFYQTAGVAAYFQDTDQDGYEDRPFVYTSENIRDFLVNQGYQVERIYKAQSSVNPTHFSARYDYGTPLPAELLRENGFGWNGEASQINNLVNNGAFWLGHRDHGFSRGWVYPYYTTDHLNSLTNQSQLPFITSFNCQSGWFDDETDNDPSTNFVSFAEKWQRLSSGGAVGIIASTRTSFTTHNDELNYGIVDAVWPSFTDTLGTPFGTEEPNYLLGSILLHAKAYYCSRFYPSTTRKIEMEEFHLFGDPAAEIWTAVPQSLTVLLPAAITQGATTLSFQTDEDGVLITVVQNGKLLGKAFSNQHQATLNLSAPLKEGEITITASKHNFRPFIAIVQVAPPLAVTFKGCWAYHYSDQKTILHWETASEINNLGFNVYYYRWNNLTKAKQINNQLIPATNMGSLQGSHYQFDDQNAPSSGFYWVETVELGGLKEKFGPCRLQAATVGRPRVLAKNTQRLLITWKAPRQGDYEIEISHRVRPGAKGWEIVLHIFVSEKKYEQKPGLAKGRYKVRVRKRFGEWSSYRWFQVQR